MTEGKRTYKIHTAAEVVVMRAAGAFSLWKGNRHLSEKRAIRIADDVLKTGDFGPMPIVIGKVGLAGFVVDGQHRLRAAQLLDADTADRAMMCLCWENCADIADLTLLFRTTNCGTPVPPSHWDNDVTLFCDELANAIREHWGCDVFSENKTSQRPRITAAALNCVIDSCPETREAAATHCLSVENALKKIVQMNDLAERLFTGGGKLGALKQEKISPAMLNTATKLKFFVGLQKDWLYNLIARLSEDWIAAGAGV
jgi:hypothetical protein